MHPPQLKDHSKLFGRNPLKRLRNPSYSPDISPSGFYLFGKVKSALIGREIPNETDLFEVVTEISLTLQMPNCNGSFEVRSNVAKGQLWGAGGACLTE
jgi:hypothetical protein